MCAGRPRQGAWWRVVGGRPRPQCWVRGVVRRRVRMEVEVCRGALRVRTGGAVWSTGAHWGRENQCCRQAAKLQAASSSCRPHQPHKHQSGRLPEPQARQLALARRPSSHGPAASHGRAASHGVVVGVVLVVPVHQAARALAAHGGLRGWIRWRAFFKVALRHCWRAACCSARRPFDQLQKRLVSTPIAPAAR